MRSDLVVIHSPGFCSLSSVVDIKKGVRVKQLVADPAIERFDIRILSRLSGLDELQINRLGCGPLQHRPTRKLRTVIEPDRLRQSALGGDRLETANNVMTAKREGNIYGQAFSCVVVDDVHGSDYPSGGQSIVHEVDRPALVRASGRGERITPDEAHFTLLSWMDL